MTLMLGVDDVVYETQRDWGRLPVGREFGGNISSVAVDSRDRVYVYHHGSPPVFVFDPGGELIASWGEGEIVDAHSIYIDKQDNVLLVDRDAHKVLKFSTDGELLLK